MNIMTVAERKDGNEIMKLGIAIASIGVSIGLVGTIALIIWVIVFGFKAHKDEPFGTIITVIDTGAVILLVGLGIILAVPT